MGQDHPICFPCAGENSLIVLPGKPDVANVFDVDALVPQMRRRRAADALINKEAGYTACCARGRPRVREAVATS